VRCVLGLVLVGCASTPAVDPAIDRVIPGSGSTADMVPIRVEGSGFRLITSNLDTGKSASGSVALAVGDVELTAAWRGQDLIEATVPIGFPVGTFDVTVAIDNRSAVLAGGYTSTPVPTVELGPWGAPSPIELPPPTDGDDDPSPTDDMLELYINSNRSGAADVFVATRASTSDPFGTPVLVPLVSSSGGETTPEVSYDGLVMVVSSDRPGSIGANDIWQSTRATRSDAWGDPVHVAELSSIDSETAGNITPDGLTIVFTSTRVDGSSDLFIAERASPTAAWDPPVAITACNTAMKEGSPFLSADKLTLIFDTDRDGTLDLYMSERAAPTDPFPAPVPIVEIDTTTAAEEDPWMSADGRRLVFFSTRSGVAGLWEATR
jgi:hypothetical protein